jgi:hypothetical protein
MIGHLAIRSEQTENEAMKQNGHSSRCTPARLAFADHMDRFIAGDSIRQAPQNERKCWLGRTRRLIAP